MMEKARIKELKEECRVLMSEGKHSEAIRVYVAEKLVEELREQTGEEWEVVHL